MANVNPQQLRDRYMANSHRIELEVDVHADIDFDFFDSESKSTGTSIQKPEVFETRTNTTSYQPLQTEKVQCAVTKEAENVPTILTPRKTKISMNDKNSIKFNANNLQDGNAVKNVKFYSDTSSDNSRVGLVTNVLDPREKSVNVQKLKPTKSTGRTGVVQPQQIQTTIKGKNDFQSFAAQRTENMLNRPKHNADLMNCVAYSSQDESAIENSIIDSVSPETTNEVNTSNAENVDANIQNPECNKKKEANKLTQTDNLDTIFKVEHLPKRFIPMKTKDLSMTNDLINCIAYSSQDDSAIRNLDIDLMSSDTTSEITTVTSRATSSEYSISMSERTISPRKQRKLKQSRQDESSIKFLVDTIARLDTGEGGYATSSTADSTESRSPLSHFAARVPTTNMSFSRNEVLEIERENLNLLRKINDTKNCCRKPSVTAPNLKLSSTAINRRNTHNAIACENQRILRKLNSTKAVTDTSSARIQLRRK